MQAELQAFVDWGQEWTTLEAEGVIIARPLLVLEADEEGLDLETPFLLNRFSHFWVPDTGDSSHYSWQTPLPEDAWPGFQRLARLFGIDIRYGSFGDTTTLVGSAPQLDLIAEKRILKRFTAMDRDEQHRYLSNILLLFLQQMEDLCPFSRDVDEERIEVDARIGGAVLTARLLSEVVNRLASADTNEENTGPRLAEVFSAARHTNCLHELLNTFEHI